MSETHDVFLKCLELHGFKSFAQKTLLEFPRRVVGVVGPNGSGKSNVIDALRWVLGEREAKQLRGGTLENLIFSGTPKKPAMGFAKVSLYFNNKDGRFPLETNEVVLTRRIDRSGNSQFFLNDDEVRLKDLIPMLARAKLGTRGLTMIGQGQSDLFVKSSPEERRVMIEEVLGLKEFRIKKDQAERRLLSSKINMDKVRAMLEELLPHLRLLRRQKAKWEKREEVEKKLKEAENMFYAQAYHKLHSSFLIFKEPREKLIHELKEKEKEAEALEAKVKQIDSTAGDGEKTKRLRLAINELFDKKSECERLLTKVQTTIEITSRETSSREHGMGEVIKTIEDFRKELDEILSWDDILRIKNSLRTWAERISSLFSKKPVKIEEDLLREKEKLESDLSRIKAELVSLKKDEEESALSQDELNKEFREKVELLELKKNEVRQIEHRIQSATLEFEKIKIRIEELEHDWKALGRSPEELTRLSVPNENGSLEDAERRIFRLRGELAAIGEIDDNLLKEANESEERYEFLTKELEDLEKASEDLGVLIKELEEKIGNDFEKNFRLINEEFNTYFRLMFGGGKARLRIQKIKLRETEGLPEGEIPADVIAGSVEEEKESKIKPLGIEVELNLPKKKITSLSMLSGGEKTLVSVAALFALISVSPPPFLVLDEIDAALDEANAGRFADLVKEFSGKTQFIIVTHNRATMEIADALYGVTMEDDGVSQILSMKFEEAKKSGSGGKS